MKHPFLTTSCTSSWKRVCNSFLAVGYIDLNTYLLTKYLYIIERLCFIYWLSILFISTFSFLLLLYTVSRYKRDYLHASIDIFFYIIFRLWTRQRKIRLFSTTFVLAIQKSSPLEPNDPICIAHVLLLVKNSILFALGSFKKCVNWISWS